ncbi:MAG: dihydropteroate synthase [bacterium]|nr:dihydropteroate synthase [bacterium]
MNEFLIKTLPTSSLESELEKIGFDVSYKKQASEKFEYKNFKIHNLTSAQANILKQTAISVGTDCAVNKDVITGKAELSNAILGGSILQIKKIAEKLTRQPFSLKLLSDELLKQLDNKTSATKLVGILNITPDSFSDGGKYYEPENAIKHAYQLINDGADVLDIGAESTRPYSNAISPQEQIKRIAPVLEELQNITIPISIDTRSSEVAEYALKTGASIINDVSGLDYDDNMIDIIKKYNAKVVIQHLKGTPENMQNNPTYKDVTEEVYEYLYNKINILESNGVNNIIIDVGIGFGKNRADNLTLINRINEFKSLKYPIMIGISRKSFLGECDNDNNLKDIMSVAMAYPLMQNKIDYIRVHNVKLHKQLLNFINL